MTWAPPRPASWTAKRPTPPLAPVTQHAPTQDVAGEADRKQGGQAGDRERRGLGEGDLVGEDGERVGRHGRPLSPGARGQQPDDARALGRPRAVVGVPAARIGGMDPHAHPGPVAAAFAERRRAWRRSGCRRSRRRSWPARRTRPEHDCGLRTPFQRDRDRIVHCQGVPAPQAQDAGLRRPRGRPLPHAADAHARGHTGLAHGRARARASTRTSRRRSASATTSATRRSATSARTSSTPACASASDAGFRHFEHSLRVVDVLERDGAGLNLTDDVRDGILCHSGRAPLPRTLEGRIVRIVDRVAYLNHDIDDALRAGRPRRRRAAARADRGAGADGLGAHRRARARPRRALRARRRHRPGRAGGSGHGRAARLHVRATSTSARRRGASTRRSRACCRDALRGTTPRTPSGCPTTAARPAPTLAQRVTD